MTYLFYVYLTLLVANIIVLSRQPQQKLRLLLVLIVWVIVTQLIGYYFSVYKNFCYRAYHFGEVLLMSLLYSRFILTRHYHSVFITLPILYYSFMVWYFTTVKDVSGMGFIDFLAGSVVIGFYTMLYLYEWYKGDISTDKTEQYLVPFNIATLLFYALNISLLGFENIIHKDEPAMAEIFRSIQKLSNIPLYATYLIVFIKLDYGNRKFQVAI